MASTVVCRASSPQLGSCLNHSWKIPCTVPSLGLRTSPLNRSLRSEDERRRRLDLRSKPYLHPIPKQFDFGVPKLALMACWRSAAFGRLAVRANRRITPRPAAEALRRADALRQAKIDSCRARKTKEGLEIFPPRVPFGEIRSTRIA